MNNGYHQKLNLDFELDYSHFEIIKTQLTDPYKKETFMMGRKFIDENLKRVAAECNSTIIHLTYMYTPPGQSRVIHSDTKYNPDDRRLNNATKINFVINGSGSVMKWWKVKDDSITPRIGILPNGNNYYYYAHEQCDLVETAEVLAPTMMNVGALHSVENFTDNFRWAISYVVGDENGKGLQWDDAYERFAPYFAKD